MFRFSIRAVFLGMTAVAVCLGSHMNRLRQQRIAVAAIQGVGGQVFYSYQYKDADKRIWNSNASPPGPAFVRRIVGDDFFTEVIAVDLILSEAGREQLKDLKVFRKARWMLLGHRFSQNDQEDLQRVLPECKVEL